MKVLRVFIPFLNRLSDIEVGETSDIQSGDKVVVSCKEKETDLSADTYNASVVSLIETGDKKADIDNKVKVIRIFGEKDFLTLEQNKDEEKKLYDIFQKEYQFFNLDLVPISCMLSITGKTVLFTFTANQRVDFRELVKTLATKMKKRIVLRHIGARDRASSSGGFGVCGREICCSLFLSELPSVKAEVVKEQEFSVKNIENLSGLCGKLKCCLTYEVDQYKEMKKKMPKIGSSTMHEGKKGTIIGLDIFNQKVKIKFEDKIEVVETKKLNKK